MNIKNIIIALILFSSTNLFCMDMKIRTEPNDKMAMEIETFETPIQLFENFKLLSEQEFNNLICNELKKGYVNLIDSRGCPSFVHAIRNNYKYAIKILSERRCYLNISNEYLNEVLFYFKKAREITK